MTGSSLLALDANGNAEKRNVDEDQQNAGNDEIETVTKTGHASAVPGEFLTFGQCENVVA